MFDYLVLEEISKSQKQTEKSIKFQSVQKILNQLILTSSKIIRTFKKVMIWQNSFRSPCKQFFNAVFLEMISPLIIQPTLVLFINTIIPESIPLISCTIGSTIIISTYLAKHELRSHLLYYWIVLSITYTIIVFEFIVVPESVIEPSENFILVLFTVVALFFLYLTIISKNKYQGHNSLKESESLTDKNGCVSLCPACRVKMYPRNFHCQICQECILKYDHHSYWLNCCIGEVNLHYYVAGVFFAIFALFYASLLILTTICSPEFKFGILLPKDCTDVGTNIELCTCLVCGIYCVELAVILIFKIIYHSWLISIGYSSSEWKEQNKYAVCLSSPHSLGFKTNWINFFKKFRKINS